MYYDINKINFEEKLKYFRKTRNLSLEQLGKKINKAKATISKYESNQIIPDFQTILEICNILDVTMSQFFPIIYNKNTNSLKNPFLTNVLYLYYYTENMLIKSIIELREENNEIYTKFYNGIKNVRNYADENAYQYEGVLETDQTIGYINLVNSKSQGTRLEKLQISFNIPWSSKIELTNFFLLGLTPNSIPIVKKGILSTEEITDLSKFDEDLKLSSREILEIQHNNGWLLKNKNYAHFFFDK